LNTTHQGQNTDQLEEKLRNGWRMGPLRKEAEVFREENKDKDVFGSEVC